MFELPVIVLLLISIITESATTTLRGMYAKQFIMTKKLLWRFNLIQNAACAVMISFIYLLSGGNFTFSGFSVMMGVLLAAANILSLNSVLKAQSCGPIAYTSVIAALSAIIPTLAGLFLGELIKPVQYVGIALMAICIVLSPDSKKDNQNKTSAKWLLFCAAAFVTSGAVGLIQKLHQRSAIHSGEMPAVLITCFVISTIVAAINYAYERKDQYLGTEDGRLPKSSVIFPLATGLCFAFPHTINLFLSGQLPSVVFFPTVNLCPMIITMVLSVVLFKEHLSAKRWIGIAIGILSTVFVSGIISF